MAAPWEDLPADLVANIASRLPCLADRHLMSRMYPAWRAAALLRPLPPAQLPWLLIPYRSAAILPPHSAHRRASVFCALCDDTHRVRVPRVTGGARFFGSYQGGWVFLAHGQSCVHAIVNLRTGERVFLPDELVWEARPRLPMVIRVAALSAPPVPVEGCVAAAIVTIFDPSFLAGPPHITFWRMGSQVASCTRQFDAEDVLHHDGAFHVLSTLGNLLVCTPVLQQPLQMHMEFRRFAPLFQYRDQDIGARYLVECGGELLMAMRLSHRHQGLTSGFRVFRMTHLQAGGGPEANLSLATYAWTEMPTLEGRMLFVGRGCSRSFEVNDFPGFQEGVYFLDDGSFHAVPMISCGHGPRQYGCCNNGHWTGPPDHVRRRFLHQPPSTYSSPVWILH
ncbi:hypothetical protein ACP70R_035859 [Stipagrostis hirtigluma subsp. patula]